MVPSLCSPSVITTTCHHHAPPPSATATCPRRAPTWCPPCTLRVSSLLHITIVHLCHTPLLCVLVAHPPSTLPPLSQYHHWHVPLPCTTAACPPPRAHPMPSLHSPSALLALVLCSPSAYKWNYNQPNLWIVGKSLTSQVPPLPLIGSTTPRHSIMAQLTWLAYIFNGHNYASWAFRFEHFLTSHNLLHHWWSSNIYYTHICLLVSTWLIYPYFNASEYWTVHWWASNLYLSYSAPLDNIGKYVY